MAASLHITPSRATSSNGLNLDGAKWYFYQTGTTTPQSVYTTSALSTAHSNPVEADAAGKFPNIYFDSSLEYRGVLKTSDDATTIYDIDPINTDALSRIAQSDGAALVGFIQSGTGAVATTAQAKLREIVSLEDFYDGDFADALEEASAVGAIVNIYGSAYTCDRIVAVAADTDIVLHGTTISAAAGITSTHLLTCSGNWGVLGSGKFVGLEMDPPADTWDGVGVPQGCCIYASGTSSLNRSGYGRIGRNITFSGFPQGAVFVKWLDRFEVNGSTLEDCQTATLQYKASGSYTNIPTTNVEGDELITSAGFEAYQCNTVRIVGATIPAISKGISISARDAFTSGNTYFFGSPRHSMEHITNCERAIALGNSYDGREDKGDGSKIVYCDSATSFGHTFTDNAYCTYAQDSDNLQLGPDTATGVTASAYGFANSDSAGGRAMENVTLQIGTLAGSGASAKVIYIATDAAAVTAGHNMDIDISGGRVSGFSALINHATPGLGATLDLSWKGTTVRGTTAPMDLRIRSGEVDLTFIGCTAPLVDVGNITGVNGKAVSVKTKARGCSGTFHVRYAAGAAYAGVFQSATISIESADCTIDRALSFSLGASDSLGLLNLDINCPDLDPDNSGSSGQVMAFDANSKTFKARMRITALGLGSYTPMNVTLTNAGSVTGVYEKPIAGTLTGGALTAV